jgi:hypothetical protein
MTQPTAPERTNTANIVATVIFFVLLAGAAFFAVLLSAFFVMASDSCGATGVTCNTDWIVYAYIVVWGGVALALVGATVGTIIGGLRHRATWMWPLIGIGVVVVSFIGGFIVLGQTGSGST